MLAKDMSRSKLCH